MGTIADKLSYLNETKTQFREKLNRLGADISDNTTFRNYLIYLDNLYNGLFNLTDMSKNGIIGRTSQDGTPTPTTPQDIEDLSGDITYSVNGKNFLPINIESGTTKNGLTITKNEEGYYVLNGTTTANTTWDLYTGENITIPSGTYTGSLIDRTNIVDGYIRLDNGAYQTIFTNSSDTNTFTITEPFTFNRFYIYISNQKTFNNQVIKPMLEIGTEATSFEPYIPERDFTISLKSKNLFDSEVVQGFYTADGNISSSNTQIRTTEYIEVVPNTTYTFSNTNNLVIDRICYYNSSKTFIERSAYLNSGTFTTLNNNCKYIRFTIRASDGSDITPSSLVKPQLEKGNQATTYELYYDIHLDKIDTYEDKIYAKDNKFYLHKEIDRLDIASSYNRLMTNYSNIEYIEINKPTNFLGYDSYDMIEIKSNKAIWMATATSGWDNAQNIGKISGNANKPCWWMGFTKGTGLDNIKIALDGCYIDYPLNTSTTIEITNALYPTLYNQLKEIQDYLIKYKSKYELILNCDKPNIEY